MVNARFDADDIKRYYDRHTASFVRYGQGRASIHRAVWGPATQTQDQAFHYVDDQIAAMVRRIEPLSSAHVVDLGCGVGASLCYLAERLPVRGTGITLSRDQLLDLTKGRQAQVFDRSIDNQISRLRRKLEADPKNPRIILTAWGGGYSLTPEVEWLA